MNNCFRLVAFFFLVLCSGKTMASIRVFPSQDISGSQFHAIAQDKRGFVWIGTDYGLNKFDGYHFQKFFTSKTDSMTIDDNDISSIYCDGDGRLWVGTNHGLSLYNPETDNFTRKKFPDGLTHRVEQTYQDSHGNIWVATAGGGLYCIPKGKGEMRVIQGLTEQDWFLYRMMETNDGRLLVASFEGSYFIYTIENLKLKKIERRKTDYGPVVTFFKLKDKQILAICSKGILKFDASTGNLTDAGYDMSAFTANNVINDACMSVDGSMGLGTAGQGLMTIERGTKTLKPSKSSAMLLNISRVDVSKMMCDANGSYWLCCTGKTLCLANSEPWAFQSWNFTNEGNNPSSGVTTVVDGENGTIYCSVYGQGIFHLDREGNIIDRPSCPEITDKIYRDRKGNYWVSARNEVYSYNPVTGSSTSRVKLEGWAVRGFADDGNGNYFISDFSKGLIVYNAPSGNVRRIRQYDASTEKGLVNDWVMDLKVSKDGILWVATTDGVEAIDTRTMNQKPFGWQYQMVGEHCNCLCIRKNGEVVLGTDHGLYAYDKSKKSFTPIAPEGQLSMLKICDIVEDAKGDLWITTVNGIWQYVEGKPLVSYRNRNGIVINGFFTDTGNLLADNLVAFGTYNGLVIFNPDVVRNVKRDISDVQLSSVIIGGMTQNPMSSTFVVPASHNMILFFVSMLSHYDEAAAVVYEYNLDGEWVALGEGENMIMFNRLRPGTYNLKIRARNDNEYAQNVKEVTLIVEAPWYASTLAYIIYALLFLAALAYGFYLYRQRSKRELEDAKMKFLINTAHDLRSPLTLIMSPLRKLRIINDSEQNGETDKAEAANAIDTIDRNAQRLLTLVNQILDQRKIDNHMMRLECQETDLTKFIRAVCTMFQYNASQKNITLKVEQKAAHPVKAYIDHANFEKVICNLVSNSFKFVDEGGKVQIEVSEESADGDTPKACIRVIDNGRGIGEEDTSKLFDRFYQGHDADGGGATGTGLGLNICRSIVEMHKGTISAANRTDGEQGSIFTILLPEGKDHLQPEQIRDQAASAAGTLQHRPSKNVRVLAVDDDPEIGLYIKSELDKYFRIEVCANGETAMEMLLQQHFDVVVADVMMPVMDGIELLKRIKGNSKISHLPVILLTSKSEVEDRMQGIRYGADAYISKPFNIEELHLQIDNVVDSMRRLRGKFSGVQAQEGKIEDIEIKSYNDQLMDRIVKAINENIGDNEFKVEQLCAEVGISRSQLHRKIKEIAGIPTADFIRNIRLNQAARLLREHKVSVADVAYSTGFANQTHFSTVFKKYFGMSPSEYAEAGNASSADVD